MLRLNKRQLRKLSAFIMRSRKNLLRRLLLLLINHLVPMKRQKSRRTSQKQRLKMLCSRKPMKRIRPSTPKLRLKKTARSSIYNMKRAKRPKRKLLRLQARSTSPQTIPRLKN